MDFYVFENFRLISDEEIRLIWEWRNHIEIRKWMYNQDLIPWDIHINFINKLKTDDTKQYWLVKRRNVALAVMSIIDIKDKMGEMGHYIAPVFHEKNLGVELYYYSLEYLFNTFEIEKLYGYALTNNHAINALGNLFGYNKELVTKEVNGITCDFYARELSKETFFNKIQNHPKILKLLKLAGLEELWIQHPVL